MGEYDIDIKEIMIFELNRAIMAQLEMKPTTRILNLDELSVENVKKYLQSLHTIMWQNWLVTSDDSLEKAALWVKDLFDKVYDYTAANTAHY